MARELLDAGGMRVSPLLVVVALASNVRADPPGATAPTAPAPSGGEASYRFQTAAADLTAIGLLALGGANDNTEMKVTALGVYVAGAPLVHLLHRHPGRAAASAALRIGAPLVLAGIGAVIDRGMCNCDTPGLPVSLIGLLIGAAAASAIDIGYLSRGEDPAPALPPADRALAEPPSAPLASAEPRTLRFGLAFAF